MLRLFNQEGTFGDSSVQGGSDNSNLCNDTTTVEEELWEQDWQWHLLSLSWNWFFIADSSIKTNDPKKSLLYALKN